MNKSLLWRLMAFFMVIGGAVTLTSCFGDDDDDNPDDPSAIKTIIIDYHVDLSQTYYDFYDVDVTYLDEKGQPQTVRITETWEYHREIKQANAPKNYALNVVLNPKKDHPEINSDDYYQYLFTTDITAKLYNLRYDGSVSNNFNYSANNINTFNIKAWQLRNAMKEGVDNLFSFTRTYNGSTH